MKKLISFVMICAAALAITACGAKSSESSAESTATEATSANPFEQTTGAEGVLTPTEKYTIPADAPTGVDGGPGMVATEATTVNPNWPEDKQYREEAPDGTMVILYAGNNLGIYQLFDYVDVCDADSLIAVMISEDILEDGTEIVSFSNEGGDAKLELNELKAGYDAASEEQIVTCIVNTFVDNLSLNSLDLKVGDKDFGARSFVDKYDTIK